MSSWHVVFKHENKRDNFEWHKLRLAAFDVPSPLFQQNEEVFEKRYQFMLSNIADDHSYIFPVVRLTCVDRRFMDSYVKIISESGGEGVMLRKPNSVYENGRSHSILKYKTSKDSEALVIKTQGIYCTCKLPSGVIFTAKSKLEEEVCVDDIISFKYMFLSHSGVPNNPIVFRKRFDLVWQNVEQAFSKSLLT